MYSSQNENKNTQSFKTDGGKTTSNQVEVPTVSLPKGGGAIHGIDEKFSVNAVNGTASFSIPFPLSPSRNGFMPALGLSYNSGSGNGVFGLGWNADIPSITRKMDKKLPEYTDFDSFVFSGLEDLVPAYRKDAEGNWAKDISPDLSIARYRPRTEGSFARIEKITEGNNTYWKVTSKDNVISIYGKSESARIQHPEAPDKIYQWLLEFSCDDKGNCFEFDYKKEDNANVTNTISEKNRLNGLSKCTNAYLKRVRYCNKDHFNRESHRFEPETLSSIEYLMEIVLDYGEHDTDYPTPEEAFTWPCRVDAFSEYRTGFEIRTRRLCNRVLMFHHFAEFLQPRLIRSVDLSYDHSTAFTFLRSASQKGYILRNNGAYSQKALPPIDFNYEPLGWNTELKTLPAESIQNLPQGIDGQVYQWIDFYSEGLSGILTEQADAWFYKRNLGGGNFEHTKIISLKPSISGLASGKVHFQDIEANGQLNLVSHELKGYYEMTPDEEWNPFRNFDEFPLVDLNDPNLKMLDLNGDGKADILFSKDDAFVWYASKGPNGFDDRRETQKTDDEEKGPAIIFADATQSVVLADMSGDGLMDIVRIKNTNIVYWPNLGYGKFGAKVTMENAPLFDIPDHFNAAFIKLGDLDGSGLTDIIYTGKDSFKVYFNQSGNGWSEENIIRGNNPIPFPKIDDLTNISIIDLLGTGTGCIVWSSPLPEHTGNPLRYIDLMAGKKPHLMKGYKNNMGKEVRMDYKPSTHFYLEDRKAGTPWITKLPFPVHCLSEVETTDKIRKSRFTNQYSYHHGYYDFNEREFRGFGRVDQTDTESFDNYQKRTDANGRMQIVDERFFEPPILNRTWFHTGAYLDNDKVLSQFAHEYFQNGIVPEKLLAEPELPATLTTDEYQQALRACKGMPLHSETYSLDGSAKQQYPYNTAHHTCLIKVLQPKLDNEHAVFIVQESEALAYNYERDPSDPRISHSITIATDEFGHVLKGAAISYGRKKADPELDIFGQTEQGRTHIVFTENKFTNAINNSSDYILPAGWETKTFELTGLFPEDFEYFSISEIRDAFENATEIKYFQDTTPGQPEKRLIEHVKTQFLRNDTSGPLDFGSIESLALPYQSYQLALTPDIAASIYGDKVNEDMLINEGRYFKFDGNYWIASGRQVLDAENFYHPTEIIDPFGATTKISYDNLYHFYSNKITDPLDNESSVIGFNFRTLTPFLMHDMNDNRSGVRLDELGMVMSAFVMGKENEDAGDFLDTSSAEASENDRPGSALEYNLFNFMINGKPNFSRTSARETHYFETPPDANVIWQDSWSYSDGGGQEIMKKIQAEPGKALQENEDGTVSEIATSRRWIGNGRTIFNNKGKPVKQYEPYFSTTPDFEDSALLVERGATAIITYDAAGRAIRTDMPDGTFIKSEFDSWMQRAYDQNDNVLDSRWYAERMDNSEAFPAPEEVNAATQAAAHNNTPVVSYLNALGRTFLAVSDNAERGKYKTSTETNIEGSLLSITDSRGNDVMKYKYNMLGSQLYSLSMDAGERWMLQDISGKPIYAWNSRGFVFRFEYDKLHRPVRSYVLKPGGREINFDVVEYGEGVENDRQRNLRGKPFRHFDTAGILSNVLFDFKGNLLESTRQICAAYREDIDWNSNPTIETDIFKSTTVYDAFNRPVSITAPDNSIITPGYNEANLLESMEVQLKGTTAKTVFVKSIDYDEKGQRQSIVYGNNTSSAYKYHPKNFRLTRLLTTGRNGADILQDLSYTYDPVGNITFINDAAQQTIFFNNAVIAPSCRYTYDAVYQLIEAKGREHIGQNQMPHDNWSDSNFTKLFHKADGKAMREYKQSFTYDAVGNIEKLIHTAGLGSYTRNYSYASDSNRMNATNFGSRPDAPQFFYEYDVHGNTIKMPHLLLMEWDFKDQLRTTQQTASEDGSGQKTWYIYDGSGERVRKITERQGSSNKKEERIYLGGFEIFRSYKADGSSIELERETLHVSDGKSRIALVETKTVENGSSDETRLGVPMFRYQYGNHLGSASLEVDENANIISYEEYHPFGTTSFHAYDKNINPVAKRYRYTGMERDEESGFAYHSARYYVPWLGRWLSCDPIGVGGGINVYGYCMPNSVVNTDITGTDSKPISIKNTELGGLRVGNFDFEYDGKSQAQITLRVDFDFNEFTDPKQQALFRQDIVNAVKAWDQAAEIDVLDVKGQVVQNVQLRFRVQFVNDGSEHKVIDVHEKGYRDNVIDEINLEIDSGKPKTKPHEMGHVWGLYDEYDIDPQPWYYTPIAETFQYHWHSIGYEKDVNALMNDGSEFRTRYFENFARTIAYQFPSIKNKPGVESDGFQEYNVSIPIYSAKVKLLKNDYMGNIPVAPISETFEFEGAPITIGKRGPRWTGHSF